MKRAMVWSLVCLLFFAIPAVCLGQALPGNLGGIFSGGDCRNNPGLIQPTFYVGWAEHTKGLGLAADDTGDYTHPLGGLWLEMTTAAYLRKDFGLVLGAATLLPQSKSGNQLEGDDSGFNVVDPQLWQIEAYGDYAISGALGLIGGFRWLQYQNQIRIGDTATGAHYAFNVKANAYIPVAGLQLRYPGITVRVVGFPWVPAQLKTSNEEGDYSVFSPIYASYYEPERSFFFELAADYHLNITPDMSFGVFGKFSSYQGKFTGKDKRQQMVAPFTTSSDPVVISSIIQYWTFGGSFSLNFDSPI
ncbi:hypothetical protein ACFL2Q_04805 [Thermodesulfobacteriota bacterium]